MDGGGFSKFVLYFLYFIKMLKAKRPFPRKKGPGRGRCPLPIITPISLQGPMFYFFFYFFVPKTKKKVSWV
jgi:hypothetical protein